MKVLYLFPGNEQNAGFFMQRLSIWCFYVHLTLFNPTVKVNENATFVEDGMDDDIEFDDYSEEEEDVADIDAVSCMWEKL